jgi:cold shock protein
MSPARSASLRSRSVGYHPPVQASGQVLGGYVKKLMREKGFGFITADSGGDYFFHRSSVAHQGFEQLAEGVRVSFRPTESEKGPRAADVTVL